MEIAREGPQELQEIGGSAGGEAAGGDGMPEERLQDVQETGGEAEGEEMAWGFGGRHRRQGLVKLVGPIWQKTKLKRTDAYKVTIVLHDIKI
ncbi:hypothetical protein L7F22_063371 [Adiantum nelumboides]|nr:hypothetical protein [Adiantum nelumboides]